MADKIPTIEQSANRMIGLMHQAGKDERVQMAQMGIVRSPPPDIAIDVNTIQLH